MAAGSGNVPRSDEQFYFISVPNVTVASFKSFHDPGLSRSGKTKLTINNQEIVLVPHRGQIHAIQAKCPHQGGPLEQGEIEDLGKSENCIRCPWHSWKFNLNTGVCVSPGPNPDKKMKVFPVRVNNDEIKVGFFRAKTA